MHKAKKARFAKLPLKCYLLYLCIALFLTTGVTYSRYIAVSTGSDGAQVAQFGTFTLTETTGTTYSITPGVPISKDPKVSMTASQVAVRIYVDITFAADWTWTQADRTFRSQQELLTIPVADGWSFSAQEGKTFRFFLDLQPGQFLRDQSVFKDDAIMVSSTISYKDYYELDPRLLEITIQGRAVQLD